MFGYIRPQKSELLVREYEQYKGVYCSLCRQLGESYGIVSRLALSYDCTFLAMVAMGVSSDCPGFRQGRCVVNPLKKCTYCGGGQPGLVFAAALCVIMTYYKLRDDLEDSGFLGKCRARLLLLFAVRAHKKAARDFPELERIVASAMEAQGSVEREEAPGVDACADPTAQMLAGVFALAAKEDSRQERIFQQFGYFLGRWVYLIDAEDDIQKDLKKRSFNPFVTAYRLTPQSTLEQLFQAASRCNGVLNLTLSQAVAAIGLADFSCFGPIIFNIVQKGLPAMQKELLLKFKKEKNNV